MNLLHRSTKATMPRIDEHRDFSLSHKAGQLRPAQRPGEQRTVTGHTVQRCAGDAGSHLISFWMIKITNEVAVN